jgi:hypothetical protein
VRWALALGLCLALLITGCGGGSEDSTTSTTSTQSQNAEASIEGFGEEAQGSEREELISTFHAYLGSIAAKDYEETCSYLSERVKDGLEQFTGQAKKPLSCEELLEGLLAPQAAAIAKSQAEGEITKLRSDGETAFVVFHAPGARLYQLNLVKEGNEWKAASLSASVLAPTLPN